MKKYGDTARVAVVAALVSGQTVFEVAKRLNVSHSTVSRIKTQMLCEWMDHPLAVQCRALRDEVRRHLQRVEERAVEKLLRLGYTFSRIASETGIHWQTCLQSYGHVYQRLVESGQIQPHGVGELTPESLAHRKLRLYLSSYIAQKIRKNGQSVTDILVEYCGYTLEQLMAHIEAQFQPGMAWDNYGKWHIDHKTPDSWFQYSGPNDDGFQKSWALDNLQPKWAAANCSKGNRFAD